MENSGIEFLNKIYKDLHLKEEVMHTAKPSDDKNKKVERYIDRIENVTKKAVDKNKLSLLKKYYYDKYVIKKENVPDSYFRLEERIALERGYGHIKYNEQLKNQAIETIIKEQEDSIDRWLEYFTSEETSYYPTWFKYYTFQGMLKLGEYDKEKGEYTKRTSSTTKPFIEINREAVAMLYSELIKLFKKEEILDKELEKLLNNGSFTKIYSYITKKLDEINKEKSNSEEGVWKKYNQGSDPEILFNDVHGKGTGWCTAGGIETARTHINGGDFYVYYTKDKEGKFTIPRIAIRMENNKIGEIRGVAKDQNIESNMEKVVKEKLNEFPDKEEYLKKVKDMEMLTYVYTKWKNKVELTKEDLRFLYEIDDIIIGFGYEEDPRIKEITDTRNIRKDLASALDCKEEEISLTKEEALSGNIKYHYGDLDLENIRNAKGLKLPEHVGGNLRLHNLTSAEGLNLPEHVGGGLYLNSLTSVEELNLPNRIDGSLNLERLIRAKGLKLPEHVGGGLYLNSLTSVEELNLPNRIDGSLNLERLIRAKGLKLPEYVGGYLNLNSLTSADGLKLPNYIGGYLNLHSLTITEGLKLPSHVGGDLYLDSLTSAEGLNLPSHIGGYLYLDSLTSARGLELPDNFDINKLVCSDEVKMQLIRRMENSQKCKII